MVYWISLSLSLSLTLSQAELKVLLDMTSPSFSFARDLLKHNLVCHHVASCEITGHMIIRMSHDCHVMVRSYSGEERGLCRYFPHWWVWFWKQG